MVNIKIEGVSYQVEEGLTILEAAKKCGYEIPSLCAFNHGECSNGSCRVCLVEVKGARGLVASCVYPVNEGMEVTISSPKATEARRASVELLLSNHNINCQQCDKNGKCELLHVAYLTGAREGRYQGTKTPTTYDALTPAIVRDTSKCILCGRCVAHCQNAHGMGILGFENRGFNTIVAPAENRSFLNSPCIQCGQCVSVCPTGALMEKSEIAKPIYPINRLEHFCRHYNVHIGVIAVPAESAQTVCDCLVSCGISAIWNFAPVHLQVPDFVTVQSENLAVSLTSLRVQMKNQNRELSTMNRAI